jgi:hypothetical protein
MPAEGKSTIVVLGMMGRTPFAGVAWQALHYLEGLRKLGYDVYYVEDTGEWPYDPVSNSITEDCTYTTGYIARLMRRCGLAHHWAYRSGVNGTVNGLSEHQLDRLWRRTAALINLTGATVLRDDHMRVPVRIYLETDPVRPQIEVALGWQFTIDLIGAHTHHFSFGENLGRPDCGVPVVRFHYRPTRQPIANQWWRLEDGAAPEQSGCYTTVASWKQTGKDIAWQGETYTWSKHHEFAKVLDLPTRIAPPIELALNGVDARTRRRLRSHGWRLRDALAISHDPESYRSYILQSRGEFTVAKDQNVRMRSGWFSDRSACYLAAGKPVVTQDTGFGSVLPTGRGLFAFRTLDEAVQAVEMVERDYPCHSRAAQEIAAEFFGGDKVLRTMLDEVGL